MTQVIIVHTQYYVYLHIRIYVRMYDLYRSSWNNIFVNASYLINHYKFIKTSIQGYTQHNYICICQGEYWQICSLELGGECLILRVRM